MDIAAVGTGGDPGHAPARAAQGGVRVHASPECAVFEARSTRVRFATCSRCLQCGCSAKSGMALAKCREKGPRVRPRRRGEREHRARTLRPADDENACSPIDQSATKAWLSRPKQPPALYSATRPSLEALAHEAGEAADIALCSARIAKRAPTRCRSLTRASTRTSTGSPGQEQSFFARISPRRNRWPEWCEIDGASPSSRA